MAESQYRSNQTMNFCVDPAKGHDDFLMSLALVMEAANNYEPQRSKRVVNKNTPCHSCESRNPFVVSIVTNAFSNIC